VRARTCREAEMKLRGLVLALPVAISLWALLAIFMRAMYVWCQ
jgi:hypothetical protein